MIRYQRRHVPGYSQYRVFNVTGRYSWDRMLIGQVRLADRSTGRPHRWEFSRDPADELSWRYAQPSSRTAAANALMRLAGYDAVEPPARSTSRRRGVGRAFGVEIEMTGPSGSLVVQALNAHGIDVDYVGSYRRTNGSRWELKSDGSVAGHGLELVSPKLRGEPGFEELRKVCEALAECGATVDRSCGIHVHHDFRGVGVDSIKRQVLSFVERQELISRLIQPSRRSGHNYCPRWTDQHRSLLVAFESYDETSLRQIQYVGPRGTINLGSYPQHGSVEIRWHGGSTNYKKIAAWVRFGQALFKAADQGVVLPIDTVDNLLGVLRNHGLTVEDSAILLRFERHGMTRAQVQASIEAAQEMLAEVDA